jgi:glycosyltransferase involved in cell wall biosynthesis
MKISIVTICLNCRNFIGKTLDSVQHQDFANIEHIVIDGCSSDGSISLIQEYAANCQNLHWVSGKDNGISDAMNRGLALVSGDIVGFLHSDDFYPDSRVLSRVAEAFSAEPNSVWATGGAYLVDVEGDIIREIGVRRYSFSRLLRNNIIIHPSTFVRRQTLVDLGGFDITLRYAMDYDLWLRLGLIGDPIHIHSDLACFRVHAGSLSTKFESAAIEEEFQIRAALLKNRGSHVWPYRMHHVIRKQLAVLNRINIVLSGGHD